MDFGSGFKVSYSNPDPSKEKVTDLDWYAGLMLSKWQELKERDGRELEFKFEPGKFLVSESGFLATTVTTVKKGADNDFCHLNSGLNHLIRPMMYEGAYHKITNISNPEGVKKSYMVVGYICETDTFGRDRELNEVRVGDHVVLHNAGAYGFVMSSNYNMWARPAEVAVFNGEVHLIHERETFEDIIKGQKLVKFASN